MAAAVSRVKGPDTGIAGLAFPDRGVAARVAQKGELPVVDTGRGSQAQHITLQRDALQRQMLVDVALNEIGDGVGDPEVGA